jgi:hypothetical protein
MTMVHLSTSIPDSTIDKLRILAGSNRKIGLLLTDVTNLLWAHRGVLEGAKISELVITAPSGDPELKMRLDEIERRVGVLEAYTVHDIVTKISQ